MSRRRLLLILGGVWISGCSSSPSPRTDITMTPPTVDVVVSTAVSYLDAPYRYGGMTREDGFDCSGLACVAFDAAGVELPRRSRDQNAVGRAVDRNDLRRGDLVFFASDRRSRIDHVGIVSDVSPDHVAFIHATTHAGVCIDRLDEGYWAKRYVSARRVALR